MPELDTLDPVVLLGVATALIFVQTAVVIGFLVPAGQAAVLAGVLAGAGHLDLVLTYCALAGSSVLGAGIGFVLGRRYGESLLSASLLRKYEERIGRARAMVCRRAGFSLLAGRSVAVLRATTPVLAGVVGVSTRRFLVFNLAGGLLWAGVFVGSGFTGGRLIAAGSLDASIIVLVALIAVPVVGTGWFVRSRVVVPPRPQAD